MIIEVTDGCYGMGLFIDGVEWYDVPVDKQIHAFERVCELMGGEITKEMMIGMLAQIEPNHAEYDDEGGCDQCGSYYQSEIYEV